MKEEEKKPNSNIFPLLAIEFVVNQEAKQRKQKLVILIISILCWVQCRILDFKN